MTILNSSLSLDHIDMDIIKKYNNLIDRQEDAVLKGNRLFILDKSKTRFIEFALTNTLCTWFNISDELNEQLTNEVREAPHE